MPSVAKARASKTKPRAETPPSAKGATSVAGVAPKTLRDLEAGVCETRTLVEGLAMNFERLLAALDLDAAPFRESGIVARMQEAGTRLPDWRAYAAHASDTVRGWAAFGLAADTALSATTRLRLMRAFATDPHFGVREWAWLALRPVLAPQLEVAIAELQPWVHDTDANARRFASEVTRPRGVWCAHLHQLKTNPALALPLLEPLRADPAKYVRDSVANWLNDASKTSPEWVYSTTERWLRDAPSAETRAIVKRARRSHLVWPVAVAPRK
jgi:3-methyladenine DNA glycosylase AlkC